MPRKKTEAVNETEVSELQKAHDAFMKAARDAGKEPHAFNRAKLATALNVYAELFQADFIAKFASQVQE